MVIEPEVGYPHEETFELSNLPLFITIITECRYRIYKNVSLTIFFAGVNISGQFLSKSQINVSNIMAVEADYDVDVMPDQNVRR